MNQPGSPAPYVGQTQSNTTKDVHHTKSRMYTTRLSQVPTSNLYVLPAAIFQPIALLLYYVLTALLFLSWLLPRFGDEARTRRWQEIEVSPLI